MLKTILLLMAVSLIPISVTVLLRFIEEKTGFYRRMNNVLRQTIYGVLFGGISILGTVLGVWTENHTALINLRDAAPIITGLVFGGPSGIIAGVIGGVYRFVSVYWGGSGALTQVACSVSTIMAGLFTAAVRRYIFNNHHGRWYYGLTLGIMCEAFHMLMVFFTHMSDIQVAYDTVKECFVPMVLANSLAVMVSLILVAIVSDEPLWEKGSIKKLSVKIQLSLAAGLIVAYGFVSVFTYSTIQKVGQKKTEDLLTTNVNDTIAQVEDTIYSTMETDLNTMDRLTGSMLAIKETWMNTIKNNSSALKVSEIDYIVDGEILYSTEPSNKGLVMDYLGAQAQEFERWYNHEGEFADDNSKHFIQSYQPIGKDSDIKMMYGATRVVGGYIQIGYDESLFHSLIDSQIHSSTSFRHVGNDGYVVVITEKNVLLSVNNYTSDPDYLVYDLSLGEVFIQKNGDKEYYALAQYVNGYYIIALADKIESDADSNISFVATTMTILFVFMLLYYVVYAMINRFFVTRMNNVTSDLTKITQGDLSIQVNEKGSLEFIELSNGINNTVDSLKGYLEKEANKNKEELLIASAIQHSILPSSFPAFPNIDSFDLFASMDAAKAVGGDFYDFFLIDDKHLAILIADVSGKGIPAAMFMMQAKTLIKNLALDDYKVDEILTEANKGLCERNDAQMFVTCWLGIVNIKTGHVDFANAGHNPPLIKRNGVYEYLDCKPGFILGGIDSITYKHQEFDLQSGDSIFLYTDGVTEATSVNNELYGEERLVKLANTLDYVSATGFCESVISDIRDFTEGAEQSDDITMLNFVFLNKIKEKTINVKAVTENVDLVTERADIFLHANNIEKTVINQINVVIDEIFSNICKFAYVDSEEVGTVDFKIDIADNKIKMFFVDRGTPYNPLEQEDPDITLGFEEREIGGLGIFMIKKMMSDIKYEYKNNCNILMLEKEI